MRPGASGSPGRTSSSPVTTSATRGRAAQRSSRPPDRGRHPQLRRPQRGAAFAAPVSPARMSSPARRMFVARLERRAPARARPPPRCAPPAPPRRRPRAPPRRWRSARRRPPPPRSGRGARRGTRPTTGSSPAGPATSAKPSIAELSKGGTSPVADTSSASTRPSARSSATSSAPSGLTSASTRRRASSIAISPLMPPILPGTRGSPEVRSRANSGQAPPFSGVGSYCRQGRSVYELIAVP